MCASEIGPLYDKKRNLLTSDKLEMCAILLEQFNSVFTTPHPNKHVFDPDVFFSVESITCQDDELFLTDITITESIIIDSIRELSSNSAAGPDGIPCSLLLNCAHELAPSLLILFKQSISSGVIDPSLKRAAIVPVFKSGDRTAPSNYRPISLTSVIIKVLERIIRKQIVAFLVSKGYLNPTQHGFREGRSCLSALLNVFDDIMHLMSGGNTVDMVYLDFAKAFDKVDHGVLLHKIKTLGITGKLGVWLYHFLTHRTQFVRLQGGISHASPVLSGVPQGTVLGPLLFLILMGDINSGISSSSIVSFADDTRLYHGISNVDDCSFLQNDLNSIYDWASCNNMSFNAQKFQYICFSPHSSSSSNVYTSSSFDIINYSKNILDLGINVSSDCSFDFHISNLVKRTKHLTGWILRTFSSRDKLTMLTLFKALVMSRLDYGCQLWSPYLIKHINMVEKVQRSFTRFISGMAGLSYTERLAVLKLYSLQRRRERYIVIYVWKILEGLVPNLYPPICAKTSDRRGRTCISSHINVGRLGTLEYNSFRWCAIRLFNQLPLFVRNTTVCSIHSFKKQLDSYLSTVPDSPCVPGFNNSLDHGDCLRWRTPRDGLAEN